MTSPFTVFICHGFFATPAAYQPLIDALKALGVEAHCMQLPTSDLSKHNVGNVENPNFDLEPPLGGYSQGDDDTKVVTEALRKLIDEQGKKVLVLAHSAGGWVATQSAVPELQERIRQEKGLTGGIIGIMYFTAFIIPVGESIHSFYQLKDGSVFVPDWVNIHENGLITLRDPEKFLLHDLSAEDIPQHVQKLSASPSDNSVLTNDAYAALPCAYLVCEGDRMLPQEYQEGMVAAQSVKTGDFKLYRCKAGHAPHLSWTDGMAETVLDFAASLSA